MNPSNCQEYADYSQNIFNIPVRVYLKDYLSMDTTLVTTKY